MLWLTCSLALRLAAVPLGLASFAGGDQDAGRGGHHQPMATCSACNEIDHEFFPFTKCSEHRIMWPQYTSAERALLPLQDVHTLQHGRECGAAQGQRRQQRTWAKVRRTHVTAGRAAHACGRLEGRQGVAQDPEGRPRQRQAGGHDRNTIDRQKVGGIPVTCRSSAQRRLFSDSCELLVYRCAYSSLQRAVKVLPFLHKQCMIQCQRK